MTSSTGRLPAIISEGSSEKTAFEPVADSAARGHEEEDALREERVAELARTFSQASAVSHPHARPAGTLKNPFLNDDPTLDPSSPHFNAKTWATMLLHSFAQDPDRYPRHDVGVSFRDLSVHGFGTDTDYQKDVLNVLWRAPMIVRESMSNRAQKIRILRNFDGLVQPGEMLLVLGRPGRYVPSSDGALAISDC